MLITSEYAEQLKTKHFHDSTWGTSGRNFSSVVSKIVADYQPSTIIDYGCGKQTLARALPKFRIRGYDPGLPGMEEPLEPADLVICTDVLEHIEPICIDDVLDDLQRLTIKCAFLTVCVLPAYHTLPDGRNAHLIVEPLEWWLYKIMARFKLRSLIDTGPEIHFLVEALSPSGNGTK